MGKLPDKELLLTRYNNGDTLQSLADQYNVTRERVRQVISQHPDYEPYAYRRKVEDEVIDLVKQGYKFGKVAEMTGLSPQNVQRICDKHGYKSPRKKIGCKKCRTSPYARELCQACYNLWITRGKPDVPAVRQVTLKTGPKVTRTIETIGCDKCRAHPYARGLCKACYAIWIRRGKPEIEVARLKRKRKTKSEK